MTHECMLRPAAARLSQRQPRTTSTMISAGEKLCQALQTFLLRGGGRRLQRSHPSRCNINARRTWRHHVVPPRKVESDAGREIPDSLTGRTEITMSRAGSCSVNGQVNRSAAAADAGSMLRSSTFRDGWRDFGPYPVRQFERCAGKGFR